MEPSRDPGSVRSAPPRGQGLILIADDSFDTRELYDFYLTQRGFTVQTAWDGEAAIDTAVNAQPDVIVMDLSMPRVDGLQATQRLKSDPRTKHIPVIVWTAYPHKEVKRSVEDIKADVFLTKPCLPEELERLVRKLIDNGE